MSDDGPFSETDIEQFEAQLDDLTEKDLLIHILVELQAQRHYLAQLAEGADRSENERPELWECNMCGATVPDDRREDHARAEHGAPPGMDVGGEFERVEK